MGGNQARNKVMFMWKLLTGCLWGLSSAGVVAALSPTVEVEEDVYQYTAADNGAGPMWCHGSTCLVRVGDRLFASGLETVPGVKPLNNCRWILFERRDTGWEKVWVDEHGRTREPSPLAGFQDGPLFLSANPTLGTGNEPNGGPARPAIFEFKTTRPTVFPPTASLPRWKGEPLFTEHSYRSFAADGPGREMILFQNIGYTHAEWCFRDSNGTWSSQGQLHWPWAAEYDVPQPVRICYPNVAIRDRAVHFCGVSDVQEPYVAWREFKRELTGQHWDYDFRRLFYTWTPDISSKPFSQWIEIASRDKTCGWISPGDLYVAADGAVHIVWSERALDERLRAKFFPEAKQSHSLNYVLLREGQIAHRTTVEHSTEDQPAIVGSAARFQITPEGRLFLIYYASGKGSDGRQVSENRLREVLAEGGFGPAVRVPLRRPFASYFTATVRAGSPPSRTLELLGEQQGRDKTISFARIRLY